MPGGRLGIAPGAQQLAQLHQIARRALVVWAEFGLNAYVPSDAPNLFVTLPSPELANSSRGFIYEAFCLIIAPDTAVIQQVAPRILVKNPISLLFP